MNELLKPGWSLTGLPGLPVGPRLPWLPGGPCQTRHVNTSLNQTL